MSDREKCNPCNPSPSSPASGDVPEPSSPVASEPEVCAFRHTSLLQAPVAWRGALRHLGEALDDVSLEIYGLVPEASDSLTTTRARLRAIGADLGTCGRQLAELAAEPEGSELVEAEVRLCQLAGRLASQVKEVSRRLAALE